MASTASTTELLKKVRKIEIKSRGLSRQIFAGEYHSAFKGRGMAFSEVREYQYGDEIRSIDWNVTARHGAPFVKVFEEERELTVMLLVDVSGSRLFGTTDKLKKDLITEISAVLSFSAGMNNDKVGVIFFSDKIEKFIPPKKGRSHTLRIIRELLELQPQSRQTDISEALRFLTNAIKKRCSAFVLSDMMDFSPEGAVKFESALKIAASKHDIGIVRTYDHREASLPNVGIVELIDAESSQKIWVDTASRSVRSRYASWWKTTEQAMLQALSKCKVDSVSISTGEDYVRPLITLFKQR
ncbi:MAG: DUF58 domain-containing protein [Prevotellaceae bacterium]|jgi:uncharacterized protein (DUF58 family)|nr:DUF58 domain-containing protein [Prevotellaceae bacterium]